MRDRRGDSHSCMNRHMVPIAAGTTDHKRQLYTYTPSHTLDDVSRTMSGSDWIFEFCNDIIAASTPLPNVVSISWTSVELSLGRTYVETSNALLAAVGLMGITIIAASGDNGSHGEGDEGCASATTQPNWPASSPYVLSVGATQLSPSTPLLVPSSPFCNSYGCAGGGNEVVCSLATGAVITSGGGFSAFATQPTWQSASVEAYLASNPTLPPASAFNAAGRSYPDIAALGQALIMVQSGGSYSVDGTSGSAPSIAAIIGLANAARFTAGLPALGFVNPVLYSIARTVPAAFHDVTVGDNGCTKSMCGESCAGYGASAGWDAATGARRSIQSGHVAHDCPPCLGRVTHARRCTYAPQGWERQTPPFSLLLSQQFH